MAEQRLIDANALKKEIDEWLDSVGEATIAKNRAYYGELMGCIKDTPTVERLRGEWADDNVKWKCNRCGKWLVIYDGDADMNFCPECGADMRGEGE